MKKTNLIVGGSKGLGKELARQFAKENISLTIVARTKELLDSLADELGNTTVIVGDITKPETIQKINQEFQKGIDVLINNAGVIDIQNFENVDEETIDELITTNLTAPIKIARFAYLQMLKKKSGLIININSTSGLKGKLQQTIYCGTKWGLKGFTDALREEAKYNNIKVFAIHPGGMKTNLFDKCEKSTENMMEPDHVAKIILNLAKSEEDTCPDEITINRKWTKPDQ